MTKIAQYTQMDKGQLSRKITSMTKKGLLRCKQDKNDKRVQNLYLTKKATKVSDAVMPIMETRQKILLGNVKSEELKKFYGVVDKLEAASKIREIK